MQAPKRFIIINCLLLFSNSFFCQTRKEEPILAGVYITLADFEAGNLTYNIDCSTDQQKIKLHDFLERPYFDVYIKGEKHRLQKKDVYGFRDCHNQTFRFFNNQEYQLSESGNLSIYFIEQAKSSEKSFIMVNIYYFSSTPGGDIKPLTIENLKYAFPNNHKFHDALDQTFKNTDVAEFDTFHKMYKVNHVYEMSLK